MLGLFRNLVLASLLLVPVMAGAQPVRRMISQNQDGFASNLYEGNLNDTPVRDSTVVEREVPKDFNQWVMNPFTGMQDAVVPDTAQHDFQKKHLTEGLESTYLSLGNMGSPRISRIFSQRGNMPVFIFDAPFDFSIKNPSEFLFTDTKTPQLNLTYYKGGDKRNGEEHIKGAFAANFGKKAGIGIDMDYQLGRGRYANQATSVFDSRFYAYYHGDAYTAHASVNLDQLKVAENGGIEDDRFITSPESMAEGRKQYKPEDMPVNLSDNWNNIKRKQFMLTQNLVLRKKTERTDSIGDTVITRYSYKDVSTVANTTEFGFMRRRYIAYRIPSNWYQNTFLRSDSVDMFRNFYLNNTVSLNLLEGFSKWAVAGLSAYARYEFRSYQMSDTLSTGRTSEYLKRNNEFNVVVGGILQRSGGENLDFNVKAETTVAGANFADFEVDGNLDLTFPLMGRDAGLSASAVIAAQKPMYMLEHFHSQHFWWDRDLNKEFTTRVQGDLHIDRLHTRLTAGISNIKNYTYLAANGSLSQSGKALHNVALLQNSNSLQVIDATLHQDFILGPLHWENAVTWQYSSDKVVMPLPDLNVYSNLYFKFLYAKRLQFELGADVTYFTEYYAPDWSPEVGQFHLQNEQTKTKVGNYPLINAYVNCWLRSVRFYVMCYNVNDGLFNDVGGPFWAPHYPINPRMFKFGLSWTFFD